MTALFTAVSEKRGFPIDAVTQVVGRNPLYPVTVSPDGKTADFRFSEEPENPTKGWYVGNALYFQDEGRFVLQIAVRIEFSDPRTRQAFYQLLNEYNSHSRDGFFCFDPKEKALVWKWPIRLATDHKVVEAEIAEMLSTGHSMMRLFMDGLTSPELVTARTRGRA